MLIDSFPPAPRRPFDEITSLIDVHGISGIEGHRYYVSHVLCAVELYWEEAHSHCDSGQVPNAQHSPTFFNTAAWN
jgi:hypothetical protein